VIREDLRAGIDELELGLEVLGHVIEAIVRVVVDQIVELLLGDLGRGTSLDR